VNAWELLGDDSWQKEHWARIVGGRTLYSAARRTRGDHVVLFRLDVRERASENWRSGLHPIERWVRWDTPVELVAR